MTAPKIEKGFTRIPNEIFDVILNSGFTLREQTIVLTVIRYTYGFNREEAELSLRFISKATGIHYQHVRTSLKRLIEMNVLQVKKEYSLSGSSRVIILNLNYASWKISRNQIGYSESNQISSFNADESNPNSYTTVTKPVTLSVTESVTKKENIKENIKKGMIIFPSIPEELKAVKGFEESWNDWINHRKEIKKPLTSLAMDKQLKKLIEFTHNGFNIPDIIDRSIRSSWQDFYEPRDFAINNNKPKEKIWDVDKW